MDLKSEKAKSLSKTEVFKGIQEYITEQIDLSKRKCIDEENFTLAAWSEFQAFQLGIQKALSKLQTLVPDQGEKSV